MKTEYVQCHALTRTISKRDKHFVKLYDVKAKLKESCKNLTLNFVN